MSFIDQVFKLCPFLIGGWLKWVVPSTKMFRLFFWLLFWLFVCRRFLNHVYLLKDRNVIEIDRVKLIKPILTVFGPFFHRFDRVKPGHNRGYYGLNPQFVVSFPHSSKECPFSTEPKLIQLGKTGCFCFPVRCFCGSVRVQLGSFLWTLKNFGGTTQLSFFSSAASFGL